MVEAAGVEPASDKMSGAFCPCGLTTMNAVGQCSNGADVAGALPWSTHQTALYYMIPEVGELWLGISGFL